MSAPYGPPPGYYPPPPDHPQATTALILGILGLVICPLTGPFAWSIGSKSIQEIDASVRAGRPLGGRGQAQAGKILGIIGSVYLGLLILFLLFLVIIAVAAAGSHSN